MNDLKNYFSKDEQINTLKRTNTKLERELKRIVLLLESKDKTIKRLSDKLDKAYSEALDLEKMARRLKYKINIR